MEEDRSFKAFLKFLWRDFTNEMKALKDPGLWIAMGGSLAGMFVILGGFYLLLKYLPPVMLLPVLVLMILGFLIWVFRLAYTSWRDEE